MIQILNFLYYISYVYIVIYGCVFPFYFDQSTLTLKFKVVTSIFVVVSVAVTIFKQRLDEKEEKKIQDKAYYDRQEIKSGVSNLTNQQRIQEMEKRENLETNQDRLRYGIMQLDEINHHLGTVARNFSVYLNFVSLYFEQVEKIPQFYDQNEWIQSESEIYHSLEKKIRNHYESRGLSASGLPKEQLELLKKERIKLVIAKRRDFTDKQ